MTLLHRTALEPSRRALLAAVAAMLAAPSDWHSRLGGFTALVSPVSLGERTHTTTPTSTS
jgi:hypothetical protein